LFGFPKQPDPDLAVNYPSLTLSTSEQRKFGEKEIMEAKLYVGNLSYSVTEEDLQALFSQAGTVKSVTLIKDRDTGRSKGFAFVEFETQVEAEKAISMFNNYAYEERNLAVNPARPREERKPQGFQNRRGYGQQRSGGGGQSRGGEKRRRTW
jgi:RNA recognition motif-containing protein